MTVLILNSGSSSLKCQVFLFDAAGQAEVIAKAAVERIGAGLGQLTYQRADGAEYEAAETVSDHLAAIRWVLGQLTDPRHGALAALDAVDAVGHRVVHGGDRISGSVLATDEVVRVLEDFAPLAPLHNPPNLAGLRACQRALPDVPQVCVFDTAFHHSLPPECWHYGVCRELRREHGVRRYGFHGIAFRSMLAEAQRCLDRPVSELRVVSLMLGSGTSANAFDRGRSVAISTGFTPLEGLIQSTRCGDLDPGVVSYLLHAGYSSAELNTLFNRSSGLLGISGLSNDVRDLKASGEPAAKLAIDALVHRVVRYAGAYAADMGGLDCLVFGGGIAQNNPDLRARICRPLRHLGVLLDEAVNASAPRRETSQISAHSSAVPVVVAAVDEEAIIAADTREVVLERAA